MTRLRIDVAYLGARFSGWQVQRTPDGELARTVQGCLEKALAKLYRTGGITVHGASRTDAGVHADGQVAHADLPPGAPSIPADGVRAALNGILEEDVRVLAVREGAAGWHARFSAVGKRYRYRVRRGDLLLPHPGLREALWKGPLDVPAMRAAAEALCGRRDFSRFGLSGSSTKSGVRTLARLAVEENGPLLEIVALGGGFLRGLVRRLVGTLLEAGRGRTEPSAAFLHPGPMAPARGLTLEEVFYRAPGHPGATIKVYPELPETGDGYPDDR